MSAAWLENFHRITFLFTILLKLTKSSAQIPYFLSLLLKSVYVNSVGLRGVSKAFKGGRTLFLCVVVSDDKKNAQRSPEAVDPLHTAFVSSAFLIRPVSASSFEVGHFFFSYAYIIKLTVNPRSVVCTEHAGGDAPAFVSSRTQMATPASVLKPGAPQRSESDCQITRFCDT